MLRRLSRRQRRWLYLLGGITIMVVLFLWLLPVGVRYGAVYWLEEQGLQASIEDIDLNLFTGTLVISRAYGNNPDGGGFKIGHALVNLEYLPLFSKRIYLPRLELRDTRIDFRVSQSGEFSVAGLAFGDETPEEAPKDEGEPWGFGLEAVAIDSLTLRYLAPEFTREITVSSTNASDVATWQPKTPIPLDAKVRIDDATVRLSGKLRPFGERITAQIKLVVADLGLGVVAPVVRGAGIAELAGTLNTALAVQLDYRASEGLQLGVQGKLTLADARLKHPAATLAHASIDWQGSIEAKLLARDEPEAVQTNGKLRVTALDLALPGATTIRQQSLTWQGTAAVTLAEPTQVRTHGVLALDGLDVRLAHGPAIEQKRLTWEGTAGITIADTTQVRTDGALALDGLDVSLVHGPAIEQKRLTWEGTAGVTLADTTQVRSDGALALDGLDVSLADGFTLQQESLTWTGTAGATLAEATKVNAEGALALEALAMHLSDGGLVQQQQASWQGQIQVALGEAKMIDANGELQLNNSSVVLPEVLDLALGQAAWKGEANVRIPKSGAEVDTKGSLTLAKVDLALTSKGIEAELADLDWQGTVDYAPGEPALVHSDGRLRLSSPAVRISESKLVARGEEIIWQGQLALDGGIDGIAENAELPLAVDGQLTAAKLSADDGRRQRRLFQLSSLDVSGIRIRGLGDITIDSVAAKTARVLERAAEALQVEKFPYVVRLNALDARGLHLADTQRLTIDTAQADGLAGYVLRRENGEFEFVEWLSRVEDRADDEPAAKAPTAEEPSQFTFALKRLSVEGDSLFVLADQTVAPDFALTVFQIDLEILNLHSAQAAQPSPFSLNAKVGRYGDIGVQGTIRLFADPISLDLVAEIDALNLVTISGYVAAAIDRRVAQGLLDAKLDIDIEQGNIDGEAQLSLSKFELGRVVGEAGAVEQGLGLPLDKVLSLLRDGDGNVELSIPIGGNLAKPSFSIRSVVQKAILKGIQTAVLTYYSPLGVFYVGKKLVDLATALRFEPVLFEPGGTTLDGEDRAYLDKVATLLNKRPNARFIVCGHAVPGDRKALGLAAPNAQGVEEQALKAAVERLLSLARARTSAVADYLVAHGIKDNRLVPCSPTLGEGADAHPRTTISF